MAVQLKLKGLVVLAGGVVLALLLVLGVGVRRGWWTSTPNADAAEPQYHEEKAELVRVKLSPQARNNLKLVIEKLRLTTYEPVVSIPGMVVEYQGLCEHGVAAPVAGVVKHVAATPGSTVRPGDELVTLQLLSEKLQSAQVELYKTTRELQITAEEKARLEKAGGVIPEVRLVELNYQQRRLTAAQEALKFFLLSRGLTANQVELAAAGQFVSEIVLRAPHHHRHRHEVAANGEGDVHAAHASEPVVYEFEELKVELGQHVEAGQVICSLANHQLLYIEGRAFKEDRPLIERAAAHGWAITGDFAENSADGWPPFQEPLRVRCLGTRVDPGSQTLPFYVSLPNSYREHTQSGKTYRTWRFHPGQRVLLQIPVDRFSGVFVLPAAAVVHEGPEAFVFVESGNIFLRRPVHVLYEDRSHVVIANDGSVVEGHPVAQNGAASLNRVLKAQAGEDGGHHHHHHDH